MRSQVLALTIFLLALIVPMQVVATTYGYGKFGDGKYGGITVQTPIPTNVPDAGCANAPPGSAPWLYGAIAQDNHSILLYFTDSADPVDHYVLQYGLTPEAYRWGASDIGKKGVRTYLVGSLASNTTYHFRVSGANGCASGAWSNDISGTTKRNPIQSGFSPTLAIKSLDLKPSSASLPTGQANSEQASPSAEILPEITEYSLTVHVIDTNRRQIADAKVTLDDRNETHTTDEHGGVTFQKLLSGDQSVTIESMGKKASAHIFLGGSQTNQELTVTIESTPVIQSQTKWPLIAGVATLSVVAIAGLIFFFIRKRKTVI